jgi:hypothetical protein
MSKLKALWTFATVIIATFAFCLAFPFWLSNMRFIISVLMLDPALFIPTAIGGIAAGIALYWYQFEYLPKVQS